MSAPGIAARESAAPAAHGAFEAEADIVVVGGGGGGLPAALFSRWLGNDVILLEKAPELGGTAAKAAFWYWVPNNEAMRALGKEDRETDFLRYVARVSRPAGYDPDSPTFGLTEWEHAACRAIYESASPATQLLHAKGALPYRHVDAAPDYWSELPEDAAPTGRVLVHTDARESMSDGGRNSIRTMAATAREDGVDIRVSHRVQRVVTDGRAVTGVEAATPDGATHRIGARKAVIFASGGFTHDADLRRNFLGVPAFGGCAALTNEGDFVRISGRAGAQLRNMAHAWMCPIPLERAVARRPDMSGMFSVAGDSMIFVDKRGRRVVNEKLQYNELAQAFFVWDADAAEYPNLVLFQVWDQRSQDGSASDEYGRLIAPPGADDAHVVRGDTLDDLAAGLRERLSRYASVTGGLALAGDFTANLRATIERFTGFARAGVDEDFGRGERPVQLLFNGDVAEQPGGTNPTMWPIAEHGPYYAALVTGGTPDTEATQLPTPYRPGIGASRSSSTRPSVSVFGPPFVSRVPPVTSAA